MVNLIGRVTKAMGITGREDAKHPYYWQVDCPQAPSPALTVHFLTASQIAPAKVGDKVRLVYHSSATRGEWRVASILDGGE